MVNEGDVVGGFRIESVKDLSEKKGVGISARHEQTGLEVFHFLTDDRENFFGFVVSTPPEDDCGIPHILEHSILSASSDLPMKDAFFSMEKRSAATFMNAMTYPDATVFPAASAVPEDYYNLLEYYGGCVFFPLLREETFKTEGVRPERSASGAFVFNGIVYNEMKGVYSQFDAAVERSVVSSLFPDCAYRFEYGGDPNEIPSLSYEAFLDFYRRRYVPQNIKLFLYGSLPTEEQLAFLDEKILSRVTVSGERAPLPNQTRWKRPRSFSVEAPPGEEGAVVAFSWLWDEAVSPEACIEAELLSACLCGHQGTPLYRKLSESGLGSDLSPYMGGGSELRYLFFTCGLRGVKTRRINAAFDFIRSAVDEIAREGIASDVVDGVLDSYEFSMKEIKSGVPLGLRYLERMMFTWMRGGDPCEWFQIEGVFRELRRRFSDPSFIRSRLKTLLTDNSHRADIVVASSSVYFESWTRAAEKAAADLMNTRFSDPGAVERDEKAFNEYRNAPENEEALNRFPPLTRRNVRAPLLKIPYRRDEVGGCPILTTETETNGIVYLDLYFRLDQAESGLLPFFNQFSKLLLSAGQKHRSYDEAAREMTKIFGSFSSYIEIGSEPRSDKPHLFLVIRTRFLEEKAEAAVDSLIRVLCETVFTDLKRIRTVLTESKNDMAADLTQNGSLFAASYARSFLSAEAAAGDLVDGVRQYRFLSDVLKSRRRLRRFAARMTALLPEICSRRRVIYGLAGSRRAIAQTAAELTRLTEALSDALPPEVSVFDLAVSPPPQGIQGAAIASDVAFNAFVQKTGSFDFLRLARRRLLTDLMKNRLLDEVRVKSGAYGAAAFLNGRFLQMTSYRDPRVASTFEAFENTRKTFAENPPSSTELEHHIVQSLAINLKPVRPSARLSRVMLQELLAIDDDYRERLLVETANVTPEDVLDEARRLYNAEFPQVKASLAGKRMLKAIKARIDRSLSV